MLNEFVSLPFTVLFRSEHIYYFVLFTLIRSLYGSCTLKLISAIGIRVFNNQLVLQLAMDEPLNNSLMRKHLILIT